VILNPGILALVVASSLVCGMVLYAAIGGVRILRHWDISRGSEAERTTCLISTILAYLPAALEGRPLQRFAAGGAYLLSLNLGDGTGVAWKRSLVWHRPPASVCGRDRCRDKI
jgi:hypothetical protein